jgi:hypothetical protein
LRAEERQAAEAERGEYIFRRSSREVWLVSFHVLNTRRIETR